MTRTVLRLAALFGVFAFIQKVAPSETAQSGQAQTAPAKPSPAKPAAAKPAAAKPVLTGFPFTNESLLYTVKWPSGLSLGEAHLSASGTSTGWRFELGLDAGIPAYSVKDSYKSTATADLCSETFDKDSVHGSRKSKETVTVDPATATATRMPSNGVGSSKTTVPDCVRDALSFLFYARRELGQGRVPAAQEIIFGAIYHVSFQYTGAETIQVGEKSILTDKVVCHVRGPASDTQFDAYFDRDPARTPVAIRVPLTLGKFSLEIVR